MLTRGTTICTAYNPWLTGNCQRISDGQGCSDVVLEYAWLMIHLGLSGDCQSISDSQDTLARGSTLCMAVHG